MNADELMIAAFLAAIAEEEGTTATRQLIDTLRSGGVSVEAPATTPTFLSSEIGTVNASTLVVTFNSDISASNYGTGVTIKVNSVATTITSATRQANHAIVRYVIPVLYHGSGDVVTWEYNAAVGNIVGEVGSIALANVSAQTVTNNITWAALLDLQADTGVTTSVTGFTGSGTASQLGNTLTGVLSAFLSEVVIGDVITGTGINGTVTAIASDTSLTLSSSATAGAVSYTITPQASTARVATWTDQSGNGRDFTQTGTARPSKQTISSYPAIVFDGVNDWLDGSNFADALASFSVMVIVQPKNIIASNDTVIRKSPDGVLGWVLNTYGAQFSWQNAAGDQFVFVFHPAPAFDVWKMFTGEKLTTTTGHLYINGSSTGETIDVVGSPVFTNAANVSIGSSVDFPGLNLRSVMIFNPAPPAADRAALETRLGARYGLTVP